MHTYSVHKIHVYITYIDNMYHIHTYVYIHTYMCVYVFTLIDLHPNQPEGKKMRPFVLSEC